MAETWPVSLPAPLYPHDQEYTCGLEDPDEVLWPFRVRKRPELSNDLTWVFTMTQMAAFRTFYHTTLNAGTEAFTADWLELLDSSAGFARFLTPYKATLVAGDHWRVAAELELTAVEP